PIIGPPPSWVKAVAPTQAPVKASEAPVRILLSDQQVQFEAGRQTIYSEVAIKIQTPQGLAVGNISFPWRPDTDVLTVHKLLIRRGEHIIDVLASGQTFTVMRREQNLESATLDGILTANIQPNDLQVGDTLEFAASVSSSDATMKGHVEQQAAMWNDIPIERARLRMQWPTSLPIRFRQSATLPTVKPAKTGNVMVAELSIDNVEPVVVTKGAPLRYNLGHVFEATDFASWADIGELMAPLYEKASELPRQGPLPLELERIMGASSDPIVRTEAALALVQDKIRYVALAMGTGGYVPADAETTWSRRYGDCKAKTALLLGLLHAMGVQAEPVAVNTAIGDGLDERLPMVGLFNHVLVKATIGGRTYWLDGTRTGDTSLDRLRVPAFGWGLPLTSSSAALVRMMPAPLDTPTEEQSLHIDARAGLTLPAPARAETILRGDDAIITNAMLANHVGEARERVLRDYWKGEHDFIDIGSTSAAFDSKTGELRLAMEGKAKMDWSSGWYETDGTRVGYKADFSRDPGQRQDAAFAVAFPRFTRMTETILLPSGFAGEKIDDDVNVDEVVAGIAYRRHASLEGNIFQIERTERSIQPEFPAKDAAAAQTTLRRLAGQTAYLRKPPAYQPTDKEVEIALAAPLTTATQFVDRGNSLLDRGRPDEAISDFSRALALDPKNATALANRGIAQVWKGEFTTAVVDLDAAAAINPSHPVVFRARGLMAEQKGDYKGAIEAYASALTVEPGHSFALGHRAIAYRETGNDDAALKDSEAALKLNPQWVDLYVLRANIFRARGNAEDALKQAAALGAGDHSEPYAFVAAGNIYSAFKKDEDAMRMFDQAITIKPEPYIYLNRSLRRPKTDVANRKADLDAALKLDPKYAEALAAKAKLEEEGGNFAGAIAIYTASLREAPDDVGILVSRGIAYARSQDPIRSEKDFARARAKVSKPVEFNNICWNKATAGIALDAALSECNSALAAEPDVPGFLDSRGLVLLRLGRLDDAIADYDRALAKAPHMPSSLFGRAIALARKGEKAKSDIDHAAALKADPDIETQFESYGMIL
ncbi:MAG: tetratricopeptide repeat protein, partial [Sphingopyxis sp.]|nr:tetratricopeptide repeat protein [Sphingopyxis sp.]